MNKCTLIVAAGLLCLPAMGWAQQGFTPEKEKVATVKSTLYGRVVDAGTGKPLAGASVYVTDLRTGASADANGFFKVNNIPAGTYIIDITYQGYASKAASATVNGDTELDFKLSVTAAENDHVIVTGVSKATEIRRMPVPVSVMKKEELYRSSASNIIEALTRKSGVAALSTGPAIAKPVIRGLGYNRVVTLNDGLRQEGQQWGDEHGIEIDEYSVQRAEVLRGPASLMYGSDALGGVLNIMSNIPLPDNTIRTNLVGSYNDNNHLKGGHANVAGNINGFNFSAYASGKQAGDYRNAADGYVLNSRFRETDFGGFVGINRKWGYTHISVSNFDQKTGIIEGDRDDNGRFLLYAGTPFETVATDGILSGKNKLVPYQRIQHFKVAADNSFAIGNGRLSAIIGYQHNQRREFGDPEAPLTPEAYFDLQTFNYNIAYHLQEKQGWKTSIGVSGMQQQNKNKGEEAIIPDYNLFDAGLYVYTQKLIHEKLSVSGGVRLDNRTMQVKGMLDDNGKEKFTAFNKDFFNVSASAGASYNLTKDIALKLNVSRGFRAPGIPELSANGEHEGTNRYETGSQNLKNETSLQADAGIEVNSSHFTMSLTPFYNRINNYIFLEKLQNTAGSDSLTENDNGEMVSTYHYNQQDATLSGLEFSFDLHPHPFDWLHFENTFSIVRGRFANAVDGSSNLPMIAPARLISELRAEWASPKGLQNMSNLYFKAEADVNAKQNRPYTGYGTETETSGYTLINIGMGTDLVFEGRKLFSIHLAMNNVGNETYQSHLSRLKYTAENLVTGRTGVFNMGRNFTARVIIPLEFRIKA